jgi:cyclic pyranopterin phosphate synthase
MPASGIRFVPKDQLLSFEQLTRFVRILTGVGLRAVRLTGGEPLLRAELPVLVEMLSQRTAIEDLALTTNGILLPRDAAALRQAGLQRVNISLDTLHEETFRKISRREGLDRVLAGIDAAVAAGFAEVRLNALAIRDLTEDEVIPLVEFALERGLTLRFIEYMPLDADHRWEASRVLSGDRLRQRLEDHFGPLTPLPRPHAAQPARDYALPGGVGRVGLIRPVTQPFCQACNRLRLTAEGGLRNCLFSQQEWSLREQLQGDASDATILQDVRHCLAAKEAGHLINRPGFVQPERPMYQIGG